MRKKIDTFWVQLPTRICFVPACCHGEIITALIVKYSKKVHIYRYFSNKRFKKFIVLQRILLVIYYALSIRIPYFFLLEFYLKKIIITRNYKKIIILNIHLEKVRSRKLRIRLKRFLGHHRVQI